jgi:roadblock/LC7 domain-containing protein
MIKRLLILDGVLAVCLFRDDGSLVEGYGVVNEAKLRQLSALAHQYRRLLQGNADQLAMFSGMSVWTPPRGWVLSGQGATVCCVANLVCLLESETATLNDVLTEMSEVSHW